MSLSMVVLSPPGMTSAADIMQAKGLVTGGLAADSSKDILIRLTLGIRVGEQEEYDGVDFSECGLEAYPEFTRAE